MHCIMGSRCSSLEIPLSKPHAHLLVGYLWHIYDQAMVKWSDAETPSHVNRTTRRYEFIFQGHCFAYPSILFPISESEP